MDYYLQLLESFEPSAEQVERMYADEAAFDQWANEKAIEEWDQEQKEKTRIVGQTV